MKIIGKYIHIIGLVLLTTFVAAAACLYLDVPARFQKPSAPATGAKQTYTCPMHPDVVQDHPGQCPKCGMSLVRASASAPEAQSDACAGHDSGCCAKPSAARMTLPPGHPPVEGYTVAPVAGCTNHVE